MVEFLIWWQALGLVYIILLPELTKIKFETWIEGLCCEISSCHGEFIHLLIGSSLYGPLFLIVFLLATCISYWRN